MSWLSILPPLVAIAFAIWKREVTLALLLGIFTAALILSGGNPVLAFVDVVDRIVQVFASNYNTRVLMFSLLIGALIQLIRISGGVAALVNWLTWRKLTNSQRKAGLLPALLGSSIFIDTNMSVLTAGISSQAIFDHQKMSRQRLAYIIDSTCAPISVLVLLNGWGAAILGYVQETGVTDPVGVMLSSIAYNFYAIITLIIVYYTVLSTRIFGPMKQLEHQIQQKQISDNLENSKQIGMESEDLTQPTKKRYMLLPLIFMVLSILVFMFITGDGDLRQGSGSESVLWSVVLSVMLTFALLRFDAKKPSKYLMEQCFKGMGELLPLVTLVLLAFALSSAMGDIGTAKFVTSVVSDSVPVILVPALIFVIAGFVSFTTGTSWGTFGILIPIAIPLALGLGISPGLVLGAVLGGSVFGDHASPISDTTVIASLAAGCDLLDHVKTQLPYALTAGGLSVFLYLILGLLQ
ncbi:Na+/H+ antiporter NhaC family protein [Marinicella litoralis]|uniref:Transporter (NhaC family) n=1 Tax=Marinicella litoralis TaxID=644220 RepID=A0A4R6XHS0_9GAMM|nr:Na+/H+ antiporter NhaC family protein [Marinicella litoralis]TDR17420.1 transporter (NhaC family) [Marinicella litoralis]